MFSITTTMFSLRCRKKKTVLETICQNMCFPNFLVGSGVGGPVAHLSLVPYYVERDGCSVTMGTGYMITRTVTGSNWFYSSCNSFYYFDGFSSWINARMAVCWCYSLMKKTLWKLFRWQSVLKYRSPVFFLLSWKKIIFVLLCFNCGALPPLNKYEEQYDCSQICGPHSNPNQYKLTQLWNWPGIISYVIFFVFFLPSYWWCLLGRYSLGN